MTPRRKPTASLRAALVAMCGTALASVASAQTLRVRVMDSLSTLPIGGALVSTLAPDGTSGAPVMSSPDGLAVLRADSAGIYRVRVRRIGFTPFTSGELRISGDGDPVVTLAVPGLHITLGAVRIVEPRACTQRVASPSPGASPVWEEVRKALETSRLSRNASFVTISAVGYERRFGPNGALEGVDTMARGVAASRPFTARDPVLLEESGFASGAWRTGLTFFGPDEDALLSDAFTRTHCVWLADSTRRTPTGTLVGLAFEPRSDRRIPEIRGTIWVDSATSELRRVEFEYLHVPFPVEVSGVGGSVDFARAASGVWFVSSWTLRLPRWRSSNLERSGARLAGFTETVGDATIAKEARVAEYGTRRTITGTVWDSIAGGALRNGSVRIEELDLETRTDVAGNFRFENVPVGMHRIEAIAPGPRVPGRSTGATIDLVSSARVELGLALPSFATVWDRACGGTAARPTPGTVLTGRVTSLIGAVPDSSAIVQATWIDAGRIESAEVHADSVGRYVICASVRGRITLAASTGGSPVLPASIPASAMGLASRDLVVASHDIVDRLTSDYVGEERERGAAVVVSGTVRDANGRPLRDARVRLAGVQDSARTDADGRFAIRNTTPGRRLLTVATVGHSPARYLLDAYPGDSVHLDARLASIATLAAVTIRERERVSAIRDAVAQRVRSGFGYITDSLKLDKMQNTWAALQVPNATIRQNGPNSWLVTLSRPAMSGTGSVDCVPAVWVDDQISEFEQLAMIPKENIAVIEFYSRSTNVPLRYGGSARLQSSTQQGGGRGALNMATGGQSGGISAAESTRGDCGVVLTWTKPFLARGTGRP